MNYWYVARANELFIDTDNVSKSIKHTRARLAGAIECGKLDVAYAMSRPSRSKNHLHTIITLKNEPDIIQMQIWEIILHGDLYRGCCNIMRIVHCIPSWSILISPWPTFADKQCDNYRKADDSCNCTSKHNAATMTTCPAAIRLRGDNRTRGFFGKPSKNPEAILKDIWPMPKM